MSPHEIIRQRIQNQVQMVLDSAGELKRSAERIESIVKERGALVTSCNFVVMDAAELVARIAQLAELQATAQQIQEHAAIPTIAIVEAPDQSSAAIHRHGPVPCGHHRDKCDCPSLEMI